MNAREAPLTADRLCLPLGNELLKAVLDVEWCFEWVDAVMGTLDKAVETLEDHIWP